MFQLTLKCPIESINKGYVVKMSASMLLLMNSMCQMLDTACVSKVLLKNDHICMTKADGFRELKSEGGGLQGGRRRTETLWIDALGSLPVGRAGTPLDMLDVEGEAQDEEYRLDLITTCMCSFSKNTQKRLLIVF